MQHTYVYKSTGRKTDIILIIISMPFLQISNILKKREKNIRFVSILSTSVFWITAKKYYKFKE